MLINCIAIDDEPLALSKLEGFIRKVPGINMAKAFDNPVEAISWLKDNKADLIFLDIQMEALTGIQFLEVVKPETCVILTTAYDQYAIKGFDLNVTDYLLKPYSFERFMQAVSKVMDHYGRQKDTTSKIQERESFIFVKTEYRLERVDIDDILYIEGMKDYLRIICREKKIMTLQSFSKLEESLPPERFCRVHKSFLVALDKIKSIERGVILVADRRIPVSNTYRDSFFSKIRT